MLSKVFAVATIDKVVATVWKLASGEVRVDTLAAEEFVAHFTHCRFRFVTIAVTATADPQRTFADTLNHDVRHIHWVLGSPPLHFRQNYPDLPSPVTT